MRDPDRFGIYRVVGATGEQQEIATVENREALGVAIVVLAEEGEFDGATLGVFDRIESKWLVNPWPAKFLDTLRSVNAHREPEGGTA